MRQSELQPRDFWLGKKFYDTRKFPYGFSRSGIFSFSQSQLLENKGCLLSALVAGKVSNPNAEDKAFLKAIENGIYTLSTETLVWAKYKDFTRQFHTLAERPKKVRVAVDIDTSDFELLKDEQDWDVNDAANSEYLEAG